MRSYYAQEYEILFTYFYNGQDYATIRANNNEFTYLALNIDKWDDQIHKISTT